MTGRTVLFGAGLALALTATTGCMSQAEKLSLDAVKALDQCDVRTAHNDFVAAHQSDPNYPQAALGFALTDIAMLPEAPEATDLLSKLGFTAPIDMQALMFGQNGVLARFGRHDTCQSITNFFDATLPYPPLNNSSINGWSVLQAGVTGESFRADVTALMGHLQDEADALETAANKLPATNPVTFKGSACGQGTPIVLQKPEMFAAAALLEYAHAALEIGLSYDWGFGIAGVNTQNNAQVTALVSDLNAHFGHLTDASGMGRGRTALNHALSLSLNALDAATAARTSVTNELFDWPSFPVDRIADLRRMVVSAQNAVAGPSGLADITPTLIVNANLLLTSPPDAAKLSGPLFTTQTNPGGNLTLNVDQTKVDQAIGADTTPDLWTSNVPTFQWGPNAAWQGFSADPITAPARALGSASACQ